LKTEALLKVTSEKQVLIFLKF